MMKFTTLFLLSLATGAAAFSAVAPEGAAKTAAAGGAPSFEPVDKTLRGIDSDDSVFEPTGGDGAALKRNNKDEVWVSQVRQYFLLCRFFCKQSFLTHHCVSCSTTESSSSPQPKISCRPWNGQRKHCYTCQLYLPSFYPRRGFQSTYSFDAWVRTSLVGLHAC